jgi:hypothetical protein
MEVYQQDDNILKEEKTQEQKEQEEAEAYEEAMKEFRLSPAYPYIMKMIDEKISKVTDTRILAFYFGKIKSEVIGELGTLGIASLMASKPLEEIKEELS